jgi:hypothetical protein
MTFLELSSQVATTVSSFSPWAIKAVKAMMNDVIMLITAGADMARNEIFIETRLFPCPQSTDG